MGWTRIPREHHAVFEAALPADARVETLHMFGGVAALVNGHMFGGLWANSVVVRVGDADRDAVIAMPGGSVFDPTGKGRIAKDMAVLPDAVFRDGEALRSWLRRALEHTAALPPKAKKKKAPGSRRQAAEKEAAPVKKTAPARKAPAKKAPAKKAPAKKKVVAKKKTAGRR